MLNSALRTQHSALKWRRVISMAEGTKSVDQATLKMLEKAKADKVSTAFDRAEEMKPCPIGSEGSCCKNCSMGPCRVPAPKKKTETAVEKAKRRGVCGATAETIAARNFIRMIAGGAAAHSDHGRGVAETFLAAARGNAPGYEIKDEQKLYQLAMDFGVEVGDRPLREIAVEVGEKALAEFGRQEGEVVFLKRAPLKRQDQWRKLGVAEWTGKSWKSCTEPIWGLTRITRTFFCRGPGRPSRMGGAGP
jgi:carbon-monoxide dehydrogenase catalytic subunit